MAIPVRLPDQKIRASKVWRCSFTVCSQGGGRPRLNASPWVVCCVPMWCPRAASLGLYAQAWGAARCVLCLASPVLLRQAVFGPVDSPHQECEFGAPLWQGGGGGYCASRQNAPLRGQPSAGPPKLGRCLCVGSFAELPKSHTTPPPHPT